MAEPGDIPALDMVAPRMLRRSLADPTGRAESERSDGGLGLVHWIVVAIFVVSGIAGLIYEVVWSRQLVLVFGNTTQAVSAILTGFFGGMAIGNALGGWFADRVRRPLRLYGILELLVAVVAIATPALFRLSLEVYRSGYQSLETQPTTLGLLRFALALLALAPATILMGATLPTLTRYLARRSAGLSSSFARLYAANTLGAVLGAAATGFVLIELLGLSGAILVGVACSTIAGVLALSIDALSGRLSWVPKPRPSRHDATRPPSERLRPPDAAPTSATSIPGTMPGAGRSRLGIALSFAFVSGLTSLGYETLWTRLLASGTGNSTYVFTFILVVFLVGITVGAVIYDLVRPWIRDPMNTLALCQVVIAIVAISGLALVIAQPPLVNVSLSSVRFVLGKLWLAGVEVVLLPTVVMGFSLPLASRLVGATDDTVGSRTGFLLASNTVGSIVGTFVIPFFVIPLLGSPRSVALLAVANVATAFLLVWRSGAGRSMLRMVASGATVLGTVAIIATLVSPRVLLDPGEARIMAIGGTVWSTTEDDIASVQAAWVRSPHLYVTGTSMTGITVVTRLMSDLALALRPQSERSLIIGFGMGSAFRSSLVAGMKTDAVELVPSVLQMFRWFFPDAQQVLSDPRGKVIIADGRNYVELTDQRYDIIVVDPPPPTYSSGVSVISSLEFYQAARHCLNPGGVMMEWVPIVSPTAELRADERTFAAAFPHTMLLTAPAKLGTFMFGSDQPLALTASGIEAMLARPGVLADLSSAPDAPTTTVQGWLDLLMGLAAVPDGQVPASAGPGPLITDDRPLTEYFVLKGFTGGR